MITQLKINGELKDVEIENGEIKIIEQNPKQTGWERGKFRESYYAHDSRTTQHDIEVGDQYDYERYSSANYFTNKELSENISRMQTLQRQMFRWQAEHDAPIAFKSFHDNKWEIFYDVYSKELMVTDICFCVVGFIPYFSSQKVAEECLEAFKDDLTWLFTKFKWRMDSD